ncbi:ABC transporter permease [Paenibacillus amylolyticus]|uniref:Transport permease protein n=1 Tax=Paenibacillus amylolyticus TaxID=1451 RepID=A0A5M9WVY4_PAEAM|nr:ABC transporter permease [Paenibacillus amylolyticus]KAA8785639.1 ABC transporter permease [Paenibacillus amylolyticus]MDP9702717.1 ABC-type polysaccharide/polyol phosphate export permease [Paenibacillus intestini]
MLRFLNSLQQNKYLIKNMVVRDIRQRYSGSALGLLWFFIQPISMILIYTFVFSFVLKAKLGPEFGGLNFSVWLVSGLVPWMYFNEVIVRSTGSLIDNASLIKKTIFNTKWTVFSYLLTGLFTFIVFFLVVILLLIIFRVSVSWGILLIAPYLILLSVFMFGLSLALAALNVYLRDINQFLSVFLNVWFYLTPIVYPINIIPEKYRFFLEINPLYHFINNFRLIVLATGEMNVSSFLYMSCWAFISIFFGLKIFNKLKDGFADVL